MRITAMQGDTVDLICHRHYGKTAGITEQIYAANPGMADLGPILPLGTLVTLPDLSTTQADTHRPLINLWD